jgi:nicotinamide riboside kinase
MSIIVNLYGGPGTGKSTSASYLFYRAKAEGINAELVREYVKEWAWEGRVPGPFDQLYFLGKQVRKESLLYGKADLIITDSPVLLCTYYSKKYGPPYLAEGVEKAVSGHYDQTIDHGHKHLHVLLSRSKPYNASGRFQTEDQAKVLDTEIADLLKEHAEKVLNVGTNQSHLDSLFDYIKEEMKCA